MHYISVLNNITNFIESKKKLEDLGLIVKDYDNLYLVKYDKDTSMMDNEDVRKCRGIILEKNTNKLVCISPGKSINNDYYHKKYINLEDKSNIVIEEFYDGTMINVFKYKDTNYISTRSCLGAHCTYRSIKTFNTLFNECVNISIFDKLDNGHSYSFLIQHPDNRIVKDYSEPSSILVMTTRINDDNTIHILNSIETQDLLVSCDVKLKTPKIYNIESMDEIYNEIDNLNDSDQGFVLKYYDNGIDNRSKIRNLRYNEIRLLRGNNTNKMYMYFELRKNQNISEYIEYFPEDKKLFDEFRLELYTFTQRLFKYYQELKVRKKIKFLDIDYEFRPLINDLHTLYKTTKKQITKNVVINYLHNLNSAKILFVLNYSKKNSSNSQTTKNTSENTSENTSQEQHIISTTEYPLLKA